MFPQPLPSGVLKLSAYRIGENRQGNRAEPCESSQCLFFFRSRRSAGLLDRLQSVNGGEDAAGLPFFAAGDR